MNVNEINDKMTQTVIEVEKARMLHDVAVALINKSSCYPYVKDIAEDARFIVEECFRKEEQEIEKVELMPLYGIKKGDNQ